VTKYGLNSCGLITGWSTDFLLSSPYSEIFLGIQLAFKRAREFIFQDSVQKVELDI
jgi:hypothetical protein